MWVQWEEAGLEPCWVPSSARRPVLMGAHVSPHAVTRSLHSFNRCLLNVSPHAFTCVQMSSPYSYPPANTSVQSDVCAEILVPPHPSTHLFTPSVPVYMRLHWPRLSTLARSVYTACLYPFLFTPVYGAHACSHLPIPVLSDNYPCSSPALTPASCSPPLPIHTYAPFPVFWPRPAGAWVL